MTTVSCPGNFSEPLLSMIESMLRSYDVECVRHGKDDNPDVLVIVGQAPVNTEGVVIRGETPSDAIRKLVAQFGKQLPNDFFVPAHYLLPEEECDVKAEAVETDKNHDPQPAGDIAVNEAGVSAPRPDQKPWPFARRKESSC